MYDHTFRLLGKDLNYWMELHRLAQTNNLENTVSELAEWRDRALRAEGMLQWLRKEIDKINA